MSARAFGRYAAVAVIGAAVVVSLGWWWTHRPIRWRDATRPPAPAAEALDAFSRGDLDRGLERLTQAESRYDAPFWEPKIRLAGAFRALEAGRAERALALLDGRRDGGDALAPWISLARAEALFAAGRDAQAATEAGRAGIPGFPELSRAASVEARALERLGRTAEALRRLDAVPSLRLDAAALAARSGNAGDARARFVAIVLDPKSVDEGARALEALVALEPLPAARLAGATPAAIAETARRWTAARRPGPALDLLRAGFPAGAPASARPPELALAEAEACFALGRLADTRPLLARARAGDAATVDAAMYLAARIDQARGLARVSVGELAALGRRPGRSKAKLAALEDLAQLAEGAPNAGALSAWRRYREAAGPEADPVALLREGFAAFELGRRAEADAAFARVLALRDAPDGARAAATYWSARRAEQSARAPEARRLYEAVVKEFPNHVYGVFAERRLRRPPPTASDAEAEPAAAERAEEGERWLTAARLLRRLSIGPWSSAAFGAAADAAPEPIARAIRLEAADAALDRGQGAEALRWIGSAMGERDRAPVGSIPRRHWKLLLPFPENFDLSGAARVARLDPAFVAAVALEESAFDPRAVSSAGARGLLQLMPATGAELARALGIRNFTPERLFDPGTNLRLGSAYLRRLLDRYGAAAPALAAYNAGPARSDRWRLPSDESLGDRFTERIPIPATRLYVKRILANERLYRIVWGSPPEARTR
ncbi:MAG TPA: lytic transglycosylase domain-containing protein [Candidatus Polarisedimenticolaceae bacterium]